VVVAAGFAEGASTCRLAAGDGLTVLCGVADGEDVAAARAGCNAGTSPGISAWLAEPDAVCGAVACAADAEAGWAAARACAVADWVSGSNWYRL
jgi:hypothetical protein